MHKMPCQIFKKFTETTFALLAVSDSGLRCTIFQCFQKILRQQPADTTLSFTTNVHLIGLLRNFALKTMDPSVTCSWMEVRLCQIPFKFDFLECRSKVSKSRLEFFLRGMNHF